MFDKDKFKSSLTNHDIEKVLAYYNAEGTEGKNDEIVAETVCHNRTGGSHKLYYYPETQLFHCYTGCGSFDVFTLIEKRLKMEGKAHSFIDCITTLGKILEININLTSKVKGIQKNVKKIHDWDWLNKIQKKEKVQPQLKIHNEKILTYFDEIYPKAWYQAGISLETMEKYQIKFYPEMFQTVIPHHDHEGNLIGIRSRNWDKEFVKKAKYIPTYINDTGYNHPLGYALYGLYQNKEAIIQRKKAMIVEGEKSCLFSDTFYGEDNFVVAICGSNMSKYQAELLLNLGIEEVIIAIDKEYMQVDTPEFDEYMKKVKKIGQLFAPYIQTYHLTDTNGVLNYKDSPLDATKSELEEMMKVDKHILTLKQIRNED